MKSNCTPKCKNKMGKTLVECSPSELKTGDKIFLECLGNIEGNRWLDGHTENGTVDLAPDTSGGYPGTEWEVLACNGKIFLECLGNIEGNRWLDGRTQDGTVALAPYTSGEYTGTQWAIFKKI